MALRFFDSPEHDINCAECSEDDRDSRGCVPAEYAIEEEESEDGRFYIYKCEALGIDRTPFVYDDIYCYLCPRSVIRYETYELISLFSLCKQLGCLPNPGGLYNQPAALVEAFQIIASEISQLESKKLNERKESFGQKHKPQTKRKSP